MSAESDRTGDQGVRTTTMVERPTGNVAELPDSPEPLEPGADFGDRLDYAHDSTFLWANRVIEATDQKFAEPDRELEPVPVTPFVLGPRVEMFDRKDGFDLKLKFDADVKLRMPNTERRLRLVITSDTVGEAPLEHAEELSDIRVGARWDLTRWLDFDVGINARIWPALFASVKWSRTFRNGPWELYPFAKAFATTDKGLGVSSGFTVDHWHGRFLARSSSWAQWLHDNGYAEWTQYFVLARVNSLIAERRFGARVRGEDVAQGFGLIFGAGRDRKDFTGASTWAARLIYKWPLRSHWLYMYVAPGVEWKREFGYHPDGVIQIGFDMLLWGVERR